MNILETKLGLSYNTELIEDALGLYTRMNLMFESGKELNKKSIMRASGLSTFKIDKLTKLLENAGLIQITKHKNPEYVIKEKDYKSTK